MGTQLPFPRLRGMMELWASENKDVDIIIQCSSLTNYVKQDNIQFYSFLTPSDYQKIAIECEIIVGHFGTGTMITAFEYEKAALLMPRKFILGEHRNNHQELTAREFCNRKGIYQVTSQKDLFNKLNYRSDLGKAELSVVETENNLMNALRKSVLNMDVCKE